MEARAAAEDLPFDSSQEEAQSRASNSNNAQTTPQEGANNDDGTQEPRVRVHVPEVNTRVIKDAWKAYCQLRKDYISALAGTGKEHGAVAQK